MAATFFIFVLGALVVAFASRDLAPDLRRLAFYCYAAHILGAAGQVWMHLIYYGGGDMITYMKNGLPLARLLDTDFGRWFPQLLRLCFHLETEMPYVHGQGGSSGTMVGLAGMLVWVFDDRTPVWQACALTAVSSTLAHIWIVRASTVMFPDRDLHLTVAKAVFFVPSVVFWSSALLKEAVTFPFLAILLASSVAVATGKPFRGVVGIVVGAIGVGLIKGYMLAPFVIAAAGAALTARSRRTDAASVGSFRLLAILAAFVIAAFGLAAISVVFPEYAPNRIAETTAHYQQTYERLEDIGQGGSNMDFEGAGDVSLAGQLQLVPLALINALLRPAIFEVRSIVQAAAALETLVIAILFVRLVRRNPGALMRKVMQSPALTFCAIFVLTFGIAVGLSTLNLGTLSRYRIPMMPFFFVLLFVLGHQTAAERNAVGEAAANPKPLRPKPRPMRPALGRLATGGRRPT